MTITSTTPTITITIIPIATTRILKIQCKLPQTVEFPNNNVRQLTINLKILHINAGLPADYVAAAVVYEKRVPLGAVWGVEPVEGEVADAGAGGGTVGLAVPVVGVEGCIGGEVCEVDAWDAGSESDRVGGDGVVCNGGCTDEKCREDDEEL